ncbi:hypothetical protein XBJ2_1860075 [Xenorhabdus bovienii str. Jollieti]|uniref:Uncharacterized protein n=1 Tax=Xenorhabdus bovienii (strain SS-2004) TaxID=406818 RepID=D3V560_XENBS|nr:hypothetical protein XBJ1_3671 [Xenorhabdus bovienii SS-2004]CDH28572.1 hypothetical protein XBJ2_1860075 [Xenorhabdus bovienii str. Jollieti]
MVVARIAGFIVVTRRFMKEKLFNISYSRGRFLDNQGLSH